MLDFLRKTMNKTYTENGAVTYETTGSDCLDLFATIGALRDAEDSEILERFVRAYAENADTAMKILFYARDIRGGLGERRVFRAILEWLAENEPESVKKNMDLVAEYGRFDDLLVLLDTECEKEAIDVLKVQFLNDMEALYNEKQVSLLAKWLPSINASNEETVRKALKISKAFGLSKAEYRKALSALRNRIRIIENNLREKDYTFDYSKQPSRAMFKYQKAFRRNDNERYNDFIKKVNRGEASLNADNVAPYEIIAPYLYTGGRNGFMRDITPEEKEVLNATWNSLPDFGGDENALAVIDTSGSMYWGQKVVPATVALSLGLYFAERNRGVFKNCFIEFSAKSRLIDIKGKTFADRLRYIASFNQVANTNMEAVFNVILEAAVKNKVDQKDLPAKLIIISDMEFDCCTDNASSVIFENAKAKYKENGYRLPEIVFWNVASRNRQQPVTQNECGVALVSGVTPRLFEMVAGGNISPYRFMMEILEKERYARISA
ncbi:MAG: DUF2828 family protein [Lachnospiraceae bacterium]|nr:DUF2828 family protein [Lachnospiraceae bacterium]